MNYTDSRFNNIINKNDIKTIFEIGSRDAFDSISLSNQYPSSQIYCFECNPLTIDICKQNIQNSLKTNIHFFDFALGNYNGYIPFYSYVKDMNTVHELQSSGSSSFLKRDDYNETQKYIKNVKVSTIYDFCIEHNIYKIDLLCMDVQGYELNILEGSYIQNIEYIILESTKQNLKSIYESAPSYDDIHNFMLNNGFEKCVVVNENDNEENILYKKL